MRVFFTGLAFVWSLIGVWPGGQPEAQEGFTKREAKVVLDTHSVGLDGVAFEQIVAIRTADGAEVLPSAVEQASGGGHHREAVLVFPSAAQPGSVRIVVKNVGGVAERTFTWESSAR